MELKTQKDAPYQNVEIFLQYVQLCTHLCTIPALDSGTEMTK